MVSLFASTAIVAQSDPGSGLLDFRTVLLVVVTAALFIVSKRLLTLHQRLEVLESSSASTRTAPQPVSALPKEDVIPPQTVAAISAAIHTTLRARYRILSVSGPCPHRQAWSVEGRRQVFHSHKVR